MYSLKSVGCHKTDQAHILILILFCSALRVFIRSFAFSCVCITCARVYGFHLSGNFSTTLFCCLSPTAVMSSAGLSFTVFFFY